MHAVNCQGVWGSGIAKEFKTHYPKAFTGYERLCKGPRQASLAGHCSLHNDEGRLVGCLYTSWGYGAYKSPVEVILANTAMAVAELLKLEEVKGVYSPKINSGLFGVPWELTAQVIEAALLPYRYRDTKFWCVYEK